MPKIVQYSALNRSRERTLYLKTELFLNSSHPDEVIDQDNLTPC